MFGEAENDQHPTAKGCKGTVSHMRQRNGFMALGGQSQTGFFSSFFAAKPRKKKKKGYFWGIASPKPPLCKAASR
jgi:predicted SnoaL-like aldol condensation-catalyzing enzyme